MATFEDENKQTQEQSSSDLYPDIPEVPPPSEIDPIIDEEEFEEEPGQEMGFFEHLEELRSRIIKSLLGLAAAALICAIFLDFLMETVLLGPAVRAGVKLLNIEMMGQITLAIQVTLFSGLILSIPFILWQFWGFVRPGLYDTEKKMASWVAVATVFCFLLGVSFAYFVMIPASIAFATKVTWGPVTNQISVGSYFSFVLGFILACGVVFEMPMLSYALSRFGIVTPALLRRYRRHAIVGILIVAAVITPTPDPFNQLLLAVPLYVLYEVSILVAAMASKQRIEAMEEEGMKDEI